MSSDWTRGDSLPTSDPTWEAKRDVESLIESKSNNSISNTTEIPFELRFDFETYQPLE